MMKPIFSITVFCILLGLALPASAQVLEKQVVKPEIILGLKALQHLDQRVNTVGWRLGSANASYCKNKTARAGLLFHDVNQYHDQAAVKFALNFEGPIAISAVAPDSPAAAAGLRAGDDIVAINGTAIEKILPNDRILGEEQPLYRRMAAVNDMLETALEQSAVMLNIRRGGRQRLVRVESQPVCPSRFQIRVSRDRHASANGRMVSITSTLAEYVISDDELAAIAAHELSHNLLGHRQRLNAQKVNRGFFGQFGKSAKRIKATEIEADRLSIWLMTNAGYDPSAAISFWTRFGSEHGKGIFSASTHYRWKKRVKLFEEEIAKMKMIDAIDGKRPPPLLARPEPQ
ncbi:hypothetical protein MNBD_ALPHA04-1655 [hydrothermal vent metagenome]|uniref:PDZ domain-containing protein n=1 Tax=hydrothermal vent metagenome TaxID=652676 RepID=A0A3B0RVW6_9ZZZZ